MSFSGSLSKWAREGILDREVLHLIYYIKTNVFQEIHIFSYERKDLRVLEELRRRDSGFDAIHLLLPPKFFFCSTFFGRIFFSLFGPFLHRGAIKKAALLKTNQISGSWSATIAKLITGRSLLLRLGYILSRRHAMNGKKLAASVARQIENAGFRLADAIVVTSELAQREVETRSERPGKVHLVPTYVDTSVFQKKTDYDFNSPILYVGRFTPQKNLVNLIRACARENFALDLIGSGEQETELRAASAACRAPVRFLGHIPNTELAVVMRSYTYFVLPSLHEGLPKVLIEAMAIGLICIGTDVPGTSDMIRDGETGYLAPYTSADSIADALHRAREERNSLFGENARALIESRFGIGIYIDAEKNIISNSLSGKS